MAFKSETYRILIASPSDLTEERDIATEVINEWNVQHAAAEGIVLLPVKWETHAVPQTGVRPQEAINRQFVRACDICVGMFWTKIGTTTGVAESGTVEEIDEFVTAKKPAMLYFSSRLVDPNKIDMKQHRKLKKFKDKTYSTALVGSFKSADELRQKLLRDLTQQVRELSAKRGVKKTQLQKVEEAEKITEIMIRHKRHKITPLKFQQYREELLGKRTAKTIQTGNEEKDTGPNGGKIEFLKNGDMVEWIEETDERGNPFRFPMVLQRNPGSIMDAEDEFEQKVWWNRHYSYDLRKFTEEQRKNWHNAEKHAKEITKKYGLKELQVSTFDWGMMNGKLSALRWVLGSEWDFLDT
jgi:hypothetical protein